MGKSGGGSRRPSGSVRERASRVGGSKAATAPKESIHERSARLQREGGLTAEVKPAANPQATELHVVGTHAGVAAAGFANRNISLAGNPDAHFLTTLYGEHQLGAALSRHTTPELQGTARDLGLLHPGRTKAEIVSHITAHITNGRYSANFGGAKKVAAASTNPNQTPQQRAHAAKSAQYETKIAKLAQQLAQTRSEYAAHQRGETVAKATKTTTRTATPREAPLVPIRRDLPFRDLDASAPPDPAYIIQAYGAHQLARALHDYGVDALKLTAANVEAKHPGTKPTNRGQKKPLIDYIVKHST
jgi:hypothetical protein